MILWLTLLQEGLFCMFMYYSYIFPLRSINSRSTMEELFTDMPFVSLGNLFPPVNMALPNSRILSEITYLRRLIIYAHRALFELPNFRFIKSIGTSPSI